MKALLGFPAAPGGEYSERETAKGAHPGYQVVLGRYKRCEQGPGAPGIQSQPLSTLWGALG